MSSDSASTGIGGLCTQLGRFVDELGGEGDEQGEVHRTVEFGEEGDDVHGIASVRIRTVLGAIEEE
jgi:hypothetical protein